jgi:hypothetical protein
MRTTGAGISRALTTLGVIAIVALAGLAVYFTQSGGNKSETLQTTRGSPNVHSGTVDLSKLPVSQTQTQGGHSYNVVPLNLTINYNTSLYLHNGTDFAVLEYLVLNYSWTSMTGSSIHFVDLGITLGGETDCRSSAAQGSIFGDMTHIVIMLAEATFPAAPIMGTFTYSYELTKFPMVTTIINNGVPSLDEAREVSPFSTCLPSPQVTNPIFTYSLVAPTLSGYKFQDWSGYGPGSYTGPSADVTITVRGNVTESARYA